MLIIIFVGVSVRFCIYGFVHSAYAILAAQVFHALDYQLACVAIVGRVKDSPKHVVSSLIGIYMGVFALGRVVGSIVGGLAYDEFGGHIMYFGAAIGSFVSALCIILILKSRTLKVKIQTTLVA